MRSSAVEQLPPPFAILTREYYEDVTIGQMRLWHSTAHFHNFPQRPLLDIHTIELPWNDNQRRTSCIPAGTYEVVPRFSKRHRNHFHVLNVENRSLILFHVANYTRQLKGCIAVGRRHADIDHDGIVDVVNSRLAMNDLLYHARYGFILKIEPSK